MASGLFRTLARAIFVFGSGCGVSGEREQRPVEERGSAGGGAPLIALNPKPSTLNSQP